jgi:hypothetical protein
MMKNSLRNTVLLLGFAFFSTTLLASDGWLAYDSQIKAVNTTTATIMALQWEWLLRAVVAPAITRENRAIYAAG